VEALVFGAAHLCLGAAMRITSPPQGGQDQASHDMYQPLNDKTAGAGPGVAQEEGEEEDQIPEMGFFKLMSVLRPYFWPKSGKNALVHRIRAAATWFFVGLSKACSVASPVFLASATNDLANAQYRSAVVQVGLYCSLALASKWLKEAQGVVYLKVKQEAYVEIAERTFAHLHNLSLQWHLKKKMGNVIRSMDRGTEAANTLVTYLFLYLVPSLAECLAVCIVFALHFKVWTIALLAFGSVVVYGFLTVNITLWRRKFRQASNKHDNEFHDKATDSIINYETVKYFTNEEYELKRFSESVQKYQHYSVSVQASLSLLNCVQSAIVYATLMGGLAIAMDAIRRGEMNLGEFVAVNTYMINLFAPLNFLGSVYNAIIKALVDMRNLSALLSEEPDVVDAPGAKPLVVPKYSKTNPSGGVSVTYQDVFFRYPAQPPHRGLRGVSFHVPPGTTTAVVGHTGAGKTTISRLLFRFYDPQGGSLQLNGQDIKLAQQRSVRAQIGVVPQDTVMFNESILHNVRYGRLDATMEEVRQACEAAQILPFIESLPEQWDTVVGERGLKLSGGEKQRVAIARCLLKDPPVVLLDEATSALDTLTEISVQQALSKLRANRTTLVIAHRLSTIRQADQIIVMHEGQVQERGTHSALLSQGGIYTSLWQMQLRSSSQSERAFLVKQLQEEEQRQAGREDDAGTRTSKELEEILKLEKEESQGTSQAGGAKDAAEATPASSKK